MTTLKFRNSDGEWEELETQGPPGPPGPPGEGGASGRTQVDASLFNWVAQGDTPPGPGEVRVKDPWNWENPANTLYVSGTDALGLPTAWLLWLPKGTDLTQWSTSDTTGQIGSQETVRGDTITHDDGAGGPIEWFEIPISGGYFDALVGQQVMFAVGYQTRISNIEGANTQQDSRLDALESAPPPVLPSTGVNAPTGLWVPAWPFTGGTAGSSRGNGELYMTLVDLAVPIDMVGMVITTANASLNLRIVAYHANEDGSPGNTTQTTSFDFPAQNVGFQELGMDIHDPGKYWVGVHRIGSGSCALLEATNPNPAVFYPSGRMPSQSILANGWAWFGQSSGAPPITMPPPNDVTSSMPLLWVRAA